MNLDWNMINVAGLSSLGVPGVPWHPQISSDQLTLSQPRGADYAHQIILAPSDFQTFRQPCVDENLSSVWSIWVWPKVKTKEQRKLGYFFMDISLGDENSMFSSFQHGIKWIIEIFFFQYIHTWDKKKLQKIGFIFHSWQNFVRR